MRTNNFASLSACDDRKELERNGRTPPAKHPFLQEAWIVALHKLKAPAEVWFDPTLDVLQAIGQCATVVANALVDRDNVVVFEAFDDHEEYFYLRDKVEALV